MIRFCCLRPIVTGAALILAGGAAAQTPPAADATQAPIAVQETGAQTPPESAACPPRKRCSRLGATIF